MRKITIKILSFTVLLVLSSCEVIEDFTGTPGNTDKNEINKLRFVDEYIIPDGAVFQNTVVGGISGLDFANGRWYLISDDANAPIRFYEADIDFGANGFANVTIEKVVELKDSDGAAFSENTVDPEAIRAAKNGSLIWTSEGNINNGANPFVRFTSYTGDFIKEVTLDSKYEVSQVETEGPRHNGVFEGLTADTKKNGYWVAMELPLIQDGEAPTIEDTESPARIAFLDENGFGKEFVYELDAVVRRAEESSFIVNGIVELLAYDADKFLVLERSFSTGFADGGNNVRIYEVDASDATDVSMYKSLKNVTYHKAKKKLLFDFETVRSELTDGIVDNIEGIAFGPRFENGNRSLVLVADNNFSAFGPQLNQFVLLEVIE